MNDAAKQLGKLGGLKKSEAKTKAARANGGKRYSTIIDYRILGENDSHITSGRVVINKKANDQEVMDKVMDSITDEEAEAHWSIETSVEFVEKIKDKS